MIDRNGQYFGYILNFLRDGTVALPESRRELMDLHQEARYFLVQDLVKLVDAQLKRLGKDDVEPKCRIPLITSQKEEQSLIASTSRVSSIYVTNNTSSEHSTILNKEAGLW